MNDRKRPNGLRRIFPANFILIMSGNGQKLNRGGELMYGQGNKGNFTTVNINPSSQSKGYFTYFFKKVFVDLNCSSHVGSAPMKPSLLPRGDYCLFLRKIQLTGSLSFHTSRSEYCPYHCIGMKLKTVRRASK